MALTRSQNLRTVRPDRVKRLDAPIKSTVRNAKFSVECPNCARLVPLTSVKACLQCHELIGCDSCIAKKAAESILGNRPMMTPCCMTPFAVSIRLGGYIKSCGHFLTVKDVLPPAAARVQTPEGPAVSPSGPRSPYPESPRSPSP